MNTPRKMFFSAIFSTGEINDLNTLAGYVQKIEQAGFSVFLVRDDLFDLSQKNAVEPLTLMAALSTFTRHMGLVPTATTNDSEPYHVARRLASLDHISSGRAGWNIDIVDPTETAERAEEFLQIAKGLWDSYADGAVVADKKSGVYFFPDKRRPLNHNGKYFQVAGPLNVSRSPQAYPVIFYSVTSEADIDFAAKNAEVVLLSAHLIEEAPAFRESLDRAMAKAGRAEGSAQLWVEVEPENWLGSAEEIARQMMEWHHSGAVDGFALHLDTVYIDKFIKEVLPVLTHRGVFSVPEGNTLRESLGLARPQRNTL